MLFAIHTKVLYVQASDSSNNPRKRVKSKKERTVNPKKPKLDSDENSSPSTGQGKKKSRRSKEPKTKVGLWIEKEKGVVFSFNRN